MGIADLLTRSGGVCTRGDLVRMSSRADVDRALRAGVIVAVARGRYALREVDEAVRATHRLGAVVCRESAALHHGWAVKAVPAEPHVSLPRNRKVAADRLAGVTLHRDDLHPDDVDGIATSREFTLTQCLRTLTWDAALAVADSAARAGESSP